MIKSKYFENSRFLLPPLGAALLFSGSFVAAKWVTEELSPLTATLLRYALALIFLLSLQLNGRLRRDQIQRRDFPLFICLGFLGICGYHFFFFSSLSLTSVTNTAVINAFSPVVTAALAGLFIRERLNGRNYLGLFAAVIGVIILLTRGRPDILLSLRINRGDGLMLLAVVCWAGYAITLKALHRRYSTYSLTLYATVFGVAQLLVLSLFENPVEQLKHISTVSLCGLAYMGILASGMGYLCYNRSVRDLGPTRTASLVYSLVPLLVAILATIFFGESLSAAAAISLVLILAGLNLVVKK